MSSLPGKTLYASGFNPLNIPGCALWLDAADRSTLTVSGTNISQWKDKSINGLNLSQATSSSQPTLGPLLNNLQTIQFTTAQSLTSTTNLLTNPAQTWFTVFNAYNNANNNRFWLGHNSNITITGGEYFFGGNGTMWANRKSGNLSQERAIIDSVGLSVTPFNSGQWYITDIVDSNTTTDITSFSFRINGSNRNISIYSTSSNILSGTANINVFINTQGPTTNVYISEVIFYNAALTSNQIQTIEGYLASKWGLTSSLPATHPFKLYPVYNRPFQPIDISGCQIWLDAADATTLTLSGSNVTQWNDKSGNGNNATQSTSVNQPVYTTLPSSTLSGIYFASNSIQLTTISNNPLTGNASRSLFAVIFNTTNSSITRIGTGTHSSNSPPSAFGIDLNNSASTLVAPYVYTSADNSNTLQVTGTQCIYAYYDSTVSQVGGGYNFTGFTTKSTTLNTTATPWYFGLRPDNFGCVTSYICEFVLYNSVLSTSQRQAVEGYLADKWRLRNNIPSTHPFKLFPPLTPVFTPTQISGCAVWLDGADSTTVTLSGSNVTSWADKSGNGKNATTSTNYPAFSSNSLNGLSTVRFNGASGTPNFLVIPAFDFGTATRTAIFVIQNTGPSSGTASSPHWFWPITGNNTNSLSLVGWIGVFVQAQSTEIQVTASSNTYLIVVFRIGVTTGFQELFINGTRVGTKTKSIGGTSYANATSGYRLGWLTNDAFPNYYFDGNMAEVILTNTAITDTQRQVVEGYLAAKWGLLNNLPSTHPYKKIRP
jgi:hypothetical protein